MNKSNKGITLIALVVTIIVLLILAGVTISLVIGNNGIIGKANEADKQQCHASVKDQINLSVLDLTTENSVDQNGTRLKDYLISKDKANLVNNVLELKITNLLGTNAKYGNGSNKSDVYTIENNTLYYYDKDGNREKLEDIQIEEPTDESYFDFDEITGMISIKDTDSYYYIDPSGSDGTTTNKEAPIETYIIPATYNGKEVKKIGHFNAPNIKKVVIQDGPTEVESHAFADCTELESISLPDSIAGGLDNCFRNCVNLKKVNIPKGITGLYYSFTNCSSIEQIVLPPNLSGLSYDSFANCTSIKEIIIPKTVTSIGSGVFENWTSEQTIYCEAEEMPSGWYEGWTRDCNANIVWGYKK